MMFEEGSFVAIKKEYLIKANRELRFLLLPPNVKLKARLYIETIISPYVKILNLDEKIGGYTATAKNTKEAILVQTIMEKNDVITKGIWFFKLNELETLSEEEQYRAEAEWNALEL